MQSTRNQSERSKKGCILLTALGQMSLYWSFMAFNKTTRNSYTFPTINETFRLEREIERLHNEIEEAKHRKREDEQDHEKLWKDKLSKKDRDHQQELDDMKKNFEDVSLVVDKVDTLSSTMHHLTTNINTVFERSVEEREGTLRIREQQLEDREKRVIKGKTAQQFGTRITK
ncbi:hypothetical protein DICVIV_12931 [Dictyocaulus viviparus]|uniref:Uncharacterized protein n=1 Tax=Dictyocaulus viviparus TaxID=29172 RepID=A0A0D8XF86_DICVI|nr:hypothetical protein DICVIV_12931 [Dictyocaulus viviparus]